MYKMVKDVTPGDKVWSALLGEYFTVESVRVIGRKVQLKSGVYTYRAPRNLAVEVKDES